ncbi:hypothetical protein T265_05424 [Opisthorchis viverrini]|uniref:Uncharacterized protein n=1 Tax=Opisthorchis viverrini TaxID=6198 RepID=A0A074ZVZ0_OPIVI|nr:hypothetical protein T265_05424 [Opisthorchis viverrini]KER27535.1 hypothetical protein T265_05424 [Opisthorchis viverrini]
MSSEIDKTGCGLMECFQQPCEQFLLDAPRHEKKHVRRMTYPQGRHRYYTFRVGGALAELTEHGLATYDQWSGAEIRLDRNTTIGYTERTSERSYLAL